MKLIKTKITQLIETINCLDDTTINNRNVKKVCLNILKEILIIN